MFFCLEVGEVIVSSLVMLSLLIVPSSTQIRSLTAVTCILEKKKYLLLTNVHIFNKIFLNASRGIFYPKLHESVKPAEDFSSNGHIERLSSDWRERKFNI